MGTASARVLVVDNFDSFVYNLVQYVGETGAAPVVHRNNDIDAAGVVSMSPDAVIVSPGPGRPENAGSSMAIIEACGSHGIPVLGVCLGHQCIGQLFGATVVRAAEVMHGKTSEIHHDGVGVFAGIPDPFTATRYHSLVLDPATIPEVLEVSATTAGIVMGVRHRTQPIEGVQFHPESIRTDQGHSLIENFLAAGAAARS